MAKDPAFLFYPGDWTLGTMAMTRHEKGCYIDLLMAQFSLGPLTLNQIKTLLGPDQAMWTVLQAKFKTTGDGRWFNERLEAEKTKRASYTESRRNNRKKSYDETYDTTHEKHMMHHMENVNENVNENDLKGGVGEKFKSTLLKELDPSGEFQWEFQIMLKNNGLKVEQTDDIWKNFCYKVQSEDRNYTRKQLIGRLGIFMSWYKKFSKDQVGKKSNLDILKEQIGMA